MKSLDEGFARNEILEVLVPGLIQFLCLDRLCHNISKLGSIEEVSCKFKDAVWSLVKDLADEESYQSLQFLVLSEVSLVSDSQLEL